MGLQVAHSELLGYAQPCQKGFILRFIVGTFELQADGVCEFLAFWANQAQPYPDPSLLDAPSVYSSHAST